MQAGDREAAQLELHGQRAALGLALQVGAAPVLVELPAGDLLRQELRVDERRAAIDRERVGAEVCPER